ncbi:glutaredoxin [Linnemannia zychae]|nr:glutaredoxin [Linnemannia zychae]
MGESIKAMVERLIRDNKVMVFSKSYCPHSRNAKSVLTNKGVPFKALEIDLEPNGAEVQEYLRVKTGQRTVPNIFIYTQHVGGNSDLVAAKENGKLDRMLNSKSEL